MKFFRHAAFSIGASVLVRAQTRPSVPSNSTNIQVINISQNGQATITPDFTSLNIGDTLVFKFSSGIHSITQSSFAAPCVPLAGGYTTGPVYVSPNSTQPEVRAYTIPLKSEQDLWFFSGEAKECQAGMVLGVSVANSEHQAEAYKKFEEYKTNAKNATGVQNALSLISDYKLETVVVVDFSNATLAAEANIKAKIGDLVVFVLQGANYTVTQSSLDAPCTPLTGGFNGSVPAAASEVARLVVRVRTDKEIYGIYGQPGQCTGGIPFTINASEQQFQKFKQKAAAGGQVQQPGTGTPTTSAGTKTKTGDVTPATETQSTTTSTGAQSESTGTTGPDTTTKPDTTTGSDTTTEDIVEGQQGIKQRRQSAKWAMRRQLSAQPVVIY